MTILNKILCFLLFCFISFFALSSSAIAATVIDQQQISSGAVTGAPYSTTYYQGFTPTKSNFTKYYMAAICVAGNFGALTINWELLNNVSMAIATGTIASACDSNNSIFFTFDPASVYITAGQGYTMKFWNSGVGQVKYVYALGDLYGNGSASGGGLDPATADFFFQEYYDDAFTSYYFAITYPPPSAIYVGQPSTIDYNYVNPAGVYDHLTFKILNTDFNYSAISPRSFVASTSVSTAGSAQINLANGNYSLYSVEFWSLDNLTHSANLITPIAFSVANSGVTQGFDWRDYEIASSTFKMPFGLTDAQVCDGIATSSGITDLHIFGDIECGLKKFGFWAFYPNNESVNNLRASFENLKMSFPFSAYYQLADTVDSAIASSSGALSNAGTIDMVFLNKTGSTTLISVMSSTSLPNLIGTNNANLFRNTISWILWIAAAFVVFITFKKI